LKKQIWEKDELRIMSSDSLKQIDNVMSGDLVPSQIVDDRKHEVASMLATQDLAERRRMRKEYQKGKQAILDREAKQRPYEEAAKAQMLKWVDAQSAQLEEFVQGRKKHLQNWLSTQDQQAHTEAKNQINEIKR